MKQFQTEEEHQRYWDERYKKQGCNTVLHVNSTKSDKAKRKVELEWALAVQPNVEGAMGIWLSANKRSARLLDFGCGVGRWFPVFWGLSQRYTGLQYLGVDCTPEAIRLARQQHPTGRFVVLDDLNTFNEGPFDIVFCCTVLQHIVVPSMLKRTVAFLNRMLAPGGLLVLVENTEKIASLPYLTFRSQTEYRNMFPELEFTGAGVRLSGQEHFILRGEKA